MALVALSSAASPAIASAAARKSTVRREPQHRQLDAEGRRHDATDDRQMLEGEHGRDAIVRIDSKSLGFSPAATDSNTSRTARSRNSRGYVDGRPKLDPPVTTLRTPFSVGRAYFLNRLATNGSRRALVMRRRVLIDSDTGQMSVSGFVSWTR